MSMCEDQCLTWRRARENVASVLSRVLATPVCNSFPDSPQIKERSEYLLSVLYPLSPFILSHPSQFFLLISHLSLLLLTSFKQTQKKSCWTQLLAQNPLIYVLPYSSDTLECVRGYVSVCVRAVCSLSFYLNEWAVLHPVRL